MLKNFDIMPHWKKVMYIVLMLIPIILIFSWLIYIKLSENLNGIGRGSFLSPTDNSKLVTLLVIFLFVYVFFFGMIFFGKIKEYFGNNNSEKWKIDFVDTGESALKSERIKKIQKYIDGENFFLAYGDDLADVDLKKLKQMHEKNNMIATVTAVKIVSPFGILETNEKPCLLPLKSYPRHPPWQRFGLQG